MNKYMSLSGCLYASLFLVSAPTLAAPAKNPKALTFTSEEGGEAEVAQEEHHEAGAGEMPAHEPEQMPEPEHMPEHAETLPQLTEEETTPATTPALEKEPVEAAPAVTPAEEPVASTEQAAETPSLSQVEQVQEQAEQKVEQTAAVEDKALDSVQNMLKDIGANPTPAQAEQLNKVVNNYVSAANDAAKAEATRDAAQQKVVSVQIQRNVSSNRPLEAGF